MAAYYKQGSADGLVKEGTGKLLGIFITAASGSPALKVWDSLAGSGAVLLDTFTPVAATYYAMPDGGVTFTKGLFIDITNTVSYTVFYE